MRQGRLLTTIRRRARLLRLKRWVLWAVGIFFFWVLLGGPYGFFKYQQLRAREYDMIMKQRRITAQIADTQQEIERLRHDTLYIEKIAREQYGFARPNERIYKITPR